MAGAALALWGPAQPGLGHLRRGGVSRLRAGPGHPDHVQRGPPGPAVSDRAARPSYETVYENQPYTVMETRYRTAYRTENYTVMRPVTETTQVARKYTVMKPVYQTINQPAPLYRLQARSTRPQRLERRYTVMRPVYQTVNQRAPLHRLKPVYQTQRLERRTP